MADYLNSREELLGRATELFGWIETGELEVRIGDQFDLEDARDAHIGLEARRTTGKVLLHP
jgi:NADPH2:quinone reductase